MPPRRKPQLFMSSSIAMVLGSSQRRDSLMSTATRLQAQRPALAPSPFARAETPRVFGCLS
eukprot:scaffold145_cov261-Pinguiococcus_pyrenoidosus.AAC.26